MEHSLLLQLANNRDMVLSIIESLPIRISSNNGDSIRFDTFDHNNHAYSIKLSTLTYFNFRTNKRGSLIDLIAELTHKSVKEITMNIYIFLLSKGVITQCDIDIEEKDFQLEYPEPYDEKLLSNYPKVVSELFKNDNIWDITQVYWGIRYDYMRNRVVIPVYQDYELVGAIGRFNQTDVDKHKENKYLPILRYPKQTVLFGLDEYRDLIKQKKTVILVESEKSVMKAWQSLSKLPVLAIGSSNVSRHHIERLNVLGVDRIILSLDKGIEEESVLVNNLCRLSRYSQAKTIEYIDIDKCDIVRDKECIFDRDKDVVTHCFKNHLVAVRRNGEVV